ncbi:MAG: aminopeptidase [Burkholderiales bacterium]|nr:aminopeptidase [Burkholderiales bacterium]
MRWNFIKRGALLLILGTSLFGCAELGYYAQAVRGQLSIATSGRPIAEVLQDEKTSPQLRQRLESSQRIRSFASRELALPDNASYRQYVALDRPFALWNVVAAPELSLQPLRWCFPVAGCVSYRGYYDEAAAREFAAQLRNQGYDVQVSGVPAYSTLGWFSDPLLSSFINYPEPELARLIFHELAHQVLYISGDSQFNESFATAVELAGITRWLACEGDEAQRQRYAKSQQRNQEFLALIRQQRAALAQAYSELPNDEEKRAAKQRILQELQSKYAELKQSWGGYAGYDRWFSSAPGNAHFAAVNTYHEYVPGFTTLLQQQGQYADFYRAAKSLAQLPADERKQQLQQLGKMVQAPLANPALEIAPCPNKAATQSALHK